MHCSHPAFQLVPDTLIELAWNPASLTKSFSWDTTERLCPSVLSLEYELHPSDTIIDFVSCETCFMCMFSNVLASFLEKFQNYDTYAIASGQRIVLNALAC